MGNDKIRRLRAALDWTQDELASAVRSRVETATGRESSFDANTVSRLERGFITWPNSEYRYALRAVFGVDTDAELGLYSKQTRRLLASDRRDFLAASLAAILPDIVPRLSRLGMQDMDSIAERTRALEEWDRRSGGRATRHFAVGELRSTVELTKLSMTPAVRRRLCGEIAGLADLAAWSSFDAGLGASSRPTFTLGMDAAQEAGDHSVFCLIATNAARQEIHERNPGQALTLTDRAMGELPVPALAMIATVRAQAFALTGDEAQVMRQISLAESIYGRVTDLHGEPRWTWTITDEKLQSDIGFALYLLHTSTGRHSPELTARLRRATAAPATTRPRVAAMGAARLATVLYRHGELDEARHYDQVAEGLAAMVGSARLNAALTEMRAARA